MEINTKVLIVGAGPTGLVLAIWLARLGIPFRIIDKNSGPGLASRAMAVHARTLEFYRQLGFADEVINSGVRLDHFYLRKNGECFAELNLKGMGEQRSPYPFVLCFAQDDHERLLVEKLKDSGVSVEWGVELQEFTQTNTGIGDAVNLSWKLASVLDGNADSSLLKTYEPERIAFAKKLVSTTDTVFRGVAGTGWVSQFLRSLAIPNLVPMLTRFSGVRRQIFETISQIRIHYHNSPLSFGEAGRLRGGDRLPWVPMLCGDNFESLTTLKWQAHVYGTISPRFAETAKGLELPVNQFPWSELAEKTGLARDVVYLARPDGYIALILMDQNPRVLVDFMAQNKLRFAVTHGDRLEAYPTDFPRDHKLSNERI